MSKSALDEKRLNAWSIDPAHLTIIGLDTEDGPEHVLFDERVSNPIPESFVNQIKAYGGIHTPISVRKVGERIEVVAGRRRVRAARMINQETPGAILVPCMLVRGGDDRAQDVSASENTQREQDSIEISAKKCVRYIASGRTIHEAALHFNVSDQSIRNWLKFAEAPTEAKAAVREGRVSATAVARPKVATPPKKLLKALAKHDLIALVGSGAPGFDDGFRAALQWVLGGEAPEGLDRCIDACERKKQSRTAASDECASEGGNETATASEPEAAPAESIH